MPHLARAARLAIADRFFGGSFFARAFPPLSPPLRRASFTGVARSFGASPVAMSPMSFASCIGSRGRGGRFAMRRVSHGF